jgi:hypothetical protein
MKLFHKNIKDVEVIVVLSLINRGLVVLDVAKAVDCEGCQLIDTNYLKKYVIINIMIITKLQFQKNLGFCGPTLSFSTIA